MLNDQLEPSTTTNTVLTADTSADTSADQPTPPARKTDPMGPPPRADDLGDGPTRAPDAATERVWSKRAKAARAVGVLRIAVGTGLVVLPGVSVRIWAGPAANVPTAHLLARAVGVRDVYLGVQLLLEQRAGRTTKVLLMTGVAADVADAVATVLARSELSPLRRWVMPAVAGGVAAAGWLAIEAADDTEAVEKA